MNRHRNLKIKVCKTRTLLLLSESETSSFAPKGRIYIEPYNGGGGLYPIILYSSQSILWRSYTRVRWVECVAYV
jgi:hypothetical protein